MCIWEKNTVLTYGALAAHRDTSYGDLLTARILDPLGMTDTTVAVDAASLPTPRATGTSRSRVVGRCGHAHRLGAHHRRYGVAATAHRSRRTAPAAPGRQRRRPRTSASLS